MKKSWISECLKIFFLLRHNKRHFIDRKDILVNGWQKSTLQGQEKQEKEIELRISTSINVCHTTINSYDYKHFTLVKWSYAKHLEHAMEACFNVSFFSSLMMNSHSSVGPCHIWWKRWIDLSGVSMIILEWIASQEFLFLTSPYIKSCNQTTSLEFSHFYYHHHYFMLIFVSF